MASTYYIDVTAGQTVHLRSSATTQSSNVITELPRGYPVEFVSSLDPFKKVKVWDCIDTISGYVHRDYLSLGQIACSDDELWIPRYSTPSWKRSSHSTLNVWSGTSDAIAGSLKRASIAGLNDLDNTTAAKMRRSEQYIHDPDKWVATVNWGSYFELQYHGNLSINDVESVTFSDTLPGNFDVILGKLKRKGVKVYQVKGGSLHEF